MGGSVSGLLEDVSSRRAGTIGGLAGFELFARGLGEGVIGGLLTTATVGVSVGFFPAVVGDAAMWALYTFVIYTVIIGLFPESLSGLADDRVLMALLAVGAIVIAQPIATVSGATRAVATGGGTGESGWQIAVYALCVLWLVLIFGYLRFGRSEGILDSDGDVHAMLALVDPDVSDEIATYREGGSVLDRFRLGLILLLPALLLTFVCFLFGAVAAVLSTFYPIPELLFVATAGISAVAGDRIRTPDSDAERNLGRIVTSVLRSRKGISVATALPVGVMFSLFPFLAGLNAVQSVSGLRSATIVLLRMSVSEPLSAVQFFADMFVGVGTAATLLVAGGLSLWVWFRLGRRAPAFIDAWEADTDVNSSAPNRSGTDTSRPPGGVLVPIALATVAAIAHFGGGPIERGFAFLWPFGLLVAVWWVQWTLKLSPQPPRTDERAYPIAVALHGLWLIAVGVSVDVPGFVTTAWTLALLYVVFLQVYAFPDLSRLSDRASGLGRYLTSANIACLALPLAGIAVLQGTAWMAVPGSILALGGGALTAFSRHQQTGR